MHVLDLRGTPERTLEALDHGEREGLARALQPLSWLWGAGSTVHRSFRDATPFLPRPLVVGVGNARVGGTGKTPVVASLAGALAGMGVRVAVHSRGYRGEGGGDEPAWLGAQGARTVVGRDRRAAQSGLDGVDLLLLDDALHLPQRPHLSLAIVLDRDLDRPPRVLPAGPAREGPGALARADALLLRDEGARVDWPATLGGRPCFRFALRPCGLRGPGGQRQGLGDLAAGGPCLLVSGLARPRSFEADAVAAGARAVGCVRLPDHARFGPGQKRRIAREAAARGARWVLCPEKNLERLHPLPGGLAARALASRLEWGGADPVGWILRQLPLPLGARRRATP